MNEERFLDSSGTWMLESFGVSELQSFKMSIQGPSRLDLELGWRFLQGPLRLDLELGLRFLQGPLRLDLELLFEISSRAVDA
ncbi:hypothetical protein ACFX1Q_036529 [Malus domestica]